MSAGASTVPPANNTQARNSKFHDLGIRAASAAVLLVVVLAALIVGGWAWTALVAVLFAGLLWEWRTLSRHVKRERRLGFTASGLAYTMVPAFALLWLRDRPDIGLEEVLFLLLVVWMTDIGAYAVGRLVGGPKLAPAISPGKTISGALGGLVIGIATGVLVAWSPHAILPAAALSLISQVGDLAESALKRRLGVKDSGTTIPGHGGLLDRLDGILAAAPVAALLVLLTQGGLPPWR